MILTSEVIPLNRFRDRYNRVIFVDYKITKIVKNNMETIDREIRMKNQIATQNTRIARHL